MHAVQAFCVILREFITQFKVIYLACVVICMLQIYLMEDHDDWYNNKEWEESFCMLDVQNLQFMC